MMTEEGATEEDFIFNEYAIDDTLDPLSRLLKYHTSDFSLQRLVLIRELTDTAVFAGYDETVKSILPLLANFVSDAEPAVRQMFVQQLFPLAEYVVKNGGELGYQELLGKFLPFAFELLVDKNVEVGNSAVQALNRLSELVRPPQVDSHLAHVVVTLAHDERAEDYRVVAAQLFNDLAPKFGEALCNTTVISEVKLLSNDMSFSVRKIVGANLGNICKVIGASAAVEKILPVYLQLCKDEIWGVRKACAESIVTISQAITDEARLHHLIPTFKLLSEDASRWVRVAAYQNLGQLIHTIRKDDISPMFLKTFTDMAFQSEGGDSDFAEYCAFSFPAVVQVVGKERWPDLDDAFSTLLKDVQWKVRKTLAYSLHEVAKVVGTEIAERSLIPAFELFLRDLDDVKIGVVQSIDAFMSVLSPAAREKYVPMICTVPNETENWRLRNIVAMKLGPLAKLVSPKVVHEQVTEVILRLLEDSVMEVRASSFHSIAIILHHLKTSPQSGGFFDDFFSKIVALASKPAFQSRQMFVYIVQQLVEIEAPAVVDLMLDKLVALADDPVSNVRFVLARVLAMSLLNRPSYTANPKVQLASKKLADDKERDVARLATSEMPRPADPTRASAYR